MLRASLSLLLVFALGCQKDASSDSGLNGNPGFDSGAPLGDDTGDTGEGPLVEVEITPSCPYEDPPTVFTGGLVYLASIQPVSGEYTINYTGDRAVQTVGTVSWGEGTTQSRTTYLEGYTQISSEGETSFELQPNGDATSSGSSTRTALDGTENYGEWTSTKVGCTTVRETLDPETGDTTLWTGTLVSADAVEWEYEAGTNGWTFSSWGTDTSDWTTLYAFETDNPETDVAPDRLGSCEVYGAGHTTCEMIQYRTPEAYQTGAHRWELNGDHTVVFERYDETEDTPLREWGTDFNTYAGSGWREWTFLQFRTEVEVSCSGSWDEEGVGTWSCDNGDEGTYPQEF